MNSNKTYLNIDIPLLVFICGILALGLAAVSSTTQARFGNFHPFLIKQAGAAVVGLGVGYYLYRWDYHQVPAVEKWLYALNLLLLAAVLVAGRQSLGAQRWIAIGPVTFQASESAKLISIITLASFLERQKRFDRWIDILPAFMYLAPSIGLIFLQPDLGTSLVFVVTAVAMLFVAGIPGWKLSLLVGGGLGLFVLWVVLHLRYHVWMPLHQYQLNRLIVFADPQVDPLVLGYQIKEAKVAIGTGGIWGQGLFHGAITQMNYLPEQFTDFIFSAFTEEMGFAGSFGLLSLFALMLWRIFRIAGHARERLGSMLATGVGAMLAFHIVENVGMNLSLMPVAGIPLPYVSYGGTAMVIDVACLGLVMSVWRHRREIQF